jgi:hypothetical protein
MTDHERGCQGREYTCTCGYDDRRDALIETLVKALEDATAYDDFLRTFTGPPATFSSGDNAALDAAYDKWEASARAALAAAKQEMGQ